VGGIDGNKIKFVIVIFTHSIAYSRIKEGKDVNSFGKEFTSATPRVGVSEDNQLKNLFCKKVR
jgi:hypothetical protein